MSSSASTSSRSSMESDPRTPSLPSPAPQSDFQPPRRPYLDASLHRPLPDLPRQPSSESSAQQLTVSYNDRPLPVPTSPLTPEERRRSLIALDRKRRLTNHTYDEGRMRSNSGGFYDRGPNYDHGFRTSGPSSPAGRLPASFDVTRPLPEVIDLTGSSPPPAQPHTPRDVRPERASSTNSRGYVVPRWQPDSEASECPICRRPFTWMFRRHHCRKCGRVVCNDCSPHRITIPRQFIVRPPGSDVSASPDASVNQRPSVVDLADDESADDLFQGSHSPGEYPGSQLEGGEKVRLCNPCVPDPQPDPLPHYPHFRNDFVAPRASQPWSPESGSNFGLGRVGLPAEGSSSHGRGGSLFRPPRSSFQHPSVFAQNTNGHSHGRDSNLSWFGSYRGGHSPTGRRLHDLPTSLATRGYQGSSRENLPQDTRSLLSMTRPPYSEGRQPRSEPQGVPSTRPHATPVHGHERTPRTMPSVFEEASRPRLDERDICPICRRQLPPKGPNGDETAREAHIMECISARDPSYRAPGGAGGGPSQPRIYMLPFIATEKDCIGQDGGPQECSICMVEYNVGDELARLECLCKFHKQCIVEWLGHKAECPVHKLIT